MQFPACISNDLLGWSSCCVSYIKNNMTHASIEWLKQCYKQWQDDRVAGAGAGIVMEMSTSRDLNAHLRAMQCAQRSFTQEMDRGRRQHGRPRHANNPRPPKHNMIERQ